jgi:hypothetical protein
MTMFEEEESVVVESTPVVEPTPTPVVEIAPSLKEIRLKNVILKLGQAMTMDEVKTLVDEAKNYL